MRKFLILLILIPAAIFIIPKTIAMRSIAPEQSELFLKEIVEKVIPVKISGAPTASNPALIHFEDHYLMVFRYDKPVGLSVKKIWKKTSPYLGIVELDKNFQPIAPFQQLNTREDRPEVTMQAEDPRLIDLGEKVFLIFNDIKEGTKFGNRWMYIAEIKRKKKAFTLGKIHHIKPPNRPARVEKNWMPFIYKDELYMVYQPSPHEVFKVNPEDGKVEKLFITEADFHWPLGEVRGGTQAIEFEGRYLTFMHSSVWTEPTVWRKNPIRYYFMGAYTFENNPPFAVTSYTPGPLHHPEFYLARNWKRVVFPSGLVSDKSYFYVAYGENDRHINIAVIDKQRLKESLIPLSHTSN